MSSTSTTPTNRDWLHKLISGQPHQVIPNRDGATYLRRWYLIPRNPFFNVYLHHFLSSDDDRALHDHPWWFVSVILRGSYIEVSENTEGKMTALVRTSITGIRSELVRTSVTDIWTTFWRRWIAFRPATYRHRVVLSSTSDERDEVPCWTLIVTGRRSRTWGFWCKQRTPFLQCRVGDRFVPWDKFGDGGCGETA